MESSAPLPLPQSSKVIELAATLGRKRLQLAIRTSPDLSRVWDGESGLKKVLAHRDELALQRDYADVLQPLFRLLQAKLETFYQESLDNIRTFIGRDAASFATPDWEGVVLQALADVADWLLPLAETNSAVADWMNSQHGSRPKPIDDLVPHVTREQVIAISRKINDVKYSNGCEKLGLPLKPWDGADDVVADRPCDALRIPTLKKLLKESVDDLNEEDRRLIDLRRNGSTFDQIAEELKRSKAWVHERWLIVKAMLCAQVKRKRDALQNEDNAQDQP